MAHTVDQALAVECFAVEQLFQVGFQFFVILLIVQIFADVLHHLHHHQVGAAVARAFEGAQRRRHSRVGVCAGGSDHAGGEGRVVAAAVLRVEQQGNIQHAGFQLGIFHIRAQHPQEVFCRGERRIRAVDIHALVVFVVVIGVVAVHRQHGEDACQLDALAQHIGDGKVCSLGVVGGQRQHAARHGVHDIVAGRFHDNVTGKVGGHGAALAQHPAELIQLFGGGQLAEQQQIARFLKGKAAAAGAADKVLYIVTSVEQLTVGGILYAVHIFERADIGNIGQTRQHALTVFVAQTRLDAELAVKVFGDAVVLCAQGLLLVEIAHHILQMIHSCSFLFSGLYLTKFKYPFRLQEGYFSVKVRFVNKKKTKFSGCDVGVIHRFYSS